MLPQIDLPFIDALAPNSGAISNGRKLAGKSLTGHAKQQEGALIWALCAGSGAHPYQASADFTNPSTPVLRCTCPSRQLPCKHTLALLYAYANDAARFAEGEPPTDLLEKKAKAAARATKKASEGPRKPGKVNTSARLKKIDSQIESLSAFRRLLQEIVRAGLAGIDRDASQRLETFSKQLGDVGLTGLQGELRDFAASTRAKVKGETEETRSARLVEGVLVLDALARRGAEMLEAWKADPATPPPGENDLAARIGHTWQLTELEESGRVSEGAALLQLAFLPIDDAARRTFYDTGIWFHLGEGSFCQTQTIRPYRAAAHLKEEDSCFQVVEPAKLYRYPAEHAPRVRWDEFALRPAQEADYAHVIAAARDTFAPLLKEAKALFRTPLAPAQMVALVRFQRVGKVGDVTVIEDTEGARLMLEDSIDPSLPQTLSIFESQARAASDALLLSLRFDLATTSLRAVPLSLISAQGIFRLAY